MITCSSLLIVVSSLVVTLFALVYLKISKEYSFWAKQGVKGPWTVPFIGKIYSILTKNRLEVQRDCLKKYGRLRIEQGFGRLNLVIADPEVIRQVLIKDFDAFTDHNVFPFSNKYQQNFLVWLKGDKWRQVRSMISPTFTSGKIKRMFKFFQKCSDDLIEYFNENLKIADESSIVNLFDIYGMYTMDGITTCGYGIKIKHEPGVVNLKMVASKNEFINNILKIMRFPIFRILYSNLVPSFLLKKFGFNLMKESSFDLVAKRIEEIIQNRRSEGDRGNKYDDLLQLLLEAQVDDELELDENLDKVENHHAGLTNESLIGDQKKLVEKVEESSKGKRKKLSESEVMSQAIFMLVAGIDTTRVLLTNCSYTLAFHPEIQEKLYNELKKIARLSSSGKLEFDYETLTCCQYLDAVISEALRILPPSLGTDRNTLRDYHIKKYNVHVPKGTMIMIGIYSVQNDPEFWDKPQLFNPDRFMPGNREKIVPGSYLPFSMGPRHCVAMRFALTEAKIGLANVIMKFKFEPAPGLSFPPEPAFKISLNFLKDPRVRVTPR